MFKALISKQFKEIFFSMFSKELRRKKSLISFLIGMLVFSYLLIGVCAYFLSYDMCEALVGENLGWIYFAFMALTATIIGLVGSIFVIYVTVYRAKDNDLLLSMPIKPSALLFVRLLVVYIITFVLELVVLLPSFLCYFIQSPVSFEGILFSIITLITMPLWAITLGTLFALLIAYISPRLRYRSIVVMLLAVLFIAGYYYVVAQIENIFASVIVNAGEIGGFFKTLAFPFYSFGMGITVDFWYFLAYLAITLVVFGLIYLFLTKTFLSLAIKSHDLKYRNKKVKYKNQRTQFSALLKKDSSQFVNVLVYLLNSGIGIIFMILISVIVIFKSDLLISLIKILNPVLLPSLPLFAGIFICFAAGMNLITAPSITVENKKLWILKSLPIKPIKIFLSKISTHLLFTAIPAIIALVVMSIVYSFTFVEIVLVGLLVLSFITLTAISGLAINLKLPNIDAANETIAVKQSVSVLFCMLETLVICLISFFGYLFLYKTFSFEGFTIILSTVFILISALLMWWINKRGTKHFNNLQI